MLPLLFSLFLLQAPALAAGPDASAKPVGGPGPAAASAVSVELTDLPSKDLYSIHGTFVTPSPVAAVWRVLSDFQDLSGVLSGLESSRVLERDGDSVLLEQVMRGRFLVFGRTLKLLLRVRESPPTGMAFSLAGSGPFRHYDGSWAIVPQGGGSRVDYSLRVSRGDLAPRFIERGLFKDNALSLLRDLAREVARRAMAQAAPVAAAR